MKGKKKPLEFQSLMMRTQVNQIFVLYLKILRNIYITYSLLDEILFLEKYHYEPTNISYLPSTTVCSSILL